MSVLKWLTQKPSVTRFFVAYYKMKPSLLKMISVIPSIFLGFCEEAFGAAAFLLHSLTFMFVPFVSQGLPPLQVQISEILCVNFLI